MPETLQLLIDRLPTPIGTIIIAADWEGNLRVCLFAEDEETVRRYLRLQCGPTSFTLQPAADPHGLSAAITR